MLENTDIWTSGPMHLWLNNEPQKVYVPESNVKDTYKVLKSRLSQEGSIPIGIDHLPDNIIEANPILKKLDLLNVGEITEIEYANDAITIAEAELTNPQIKQLYEAGELDMVSIVAKSTTSECPKNPDYRIVNQTDITRVDIVERGACPTCNIPKPQDSSDESLVYARYSIHEIEEEEIMAEEAITMEQIEELLDKKLDEKIAPLNERLDVIEENIDIEPEPSDDDDSEEVKAMKARIAELQKETATAKVDNLIAAGKILPAQKDSAVTLCAADAEQFDAMYKDAPVIVDLDKRDSLLGGDSGNDDDDDPLKDLTDDEKAALDEVKAAFSKGD